MKETDGQRLNAIMMDLLREECEERGVSFEALAQKAGVDRSTVSRSLRKDRRPSLWVCYDLAAALDIKLSKLIAKAEKEL